MSDAFLRMKSEDIVAQIVPSRPVITRKDRERGVIWRYFVARTNQIDKEVQEVSNTLYTTLRSKRSFVAEKVRWVIRGKLDDTTLMLYTGRWDGEREAVIIPGVRSQNKASIQAASETIPALKLYLSPSQYYLGE